MRLAPSPPTEVLLSLSLGLSVSLSPALLECNQGADDRLAVGQIADASRRRRQATRETPLGSSRAPAACGSE